MRTADTSQIRSSMNPTSPLRYLAADTRRSFGARAGVEAILAGLDCDLVGVDVIQPADPFLDTAGEELRRRIFMTSDEHGRAMCLRPEFTIPVCRAHIASGRADGRYGYVGTVFRQRRDGHAEFLQAGIEDFGDRDVAGADARSIADASAMLRGLEATDFRHTLLGDQAIFDAVLEGLHLPRHWRLRLAGAFGDHAAMGDMLQRLCNPPPLPDLPDDIRAALDADGQGLEDAIAARLEEARLANSGGRTAAEIARRLRMKAREAQFRPDDGALAALDAFLALTAPLDKAVDTLHGFCRNNNLTLNGSMDVFVARIDCLARHGLAADTIVYDASFGRPLDYYTGLVFEMRGSEGAVLVGGGRYDSLLGMLGADQPMPGIGFSVWMDRLDGPSAPRGASS